VRYLAAQAADLASRGGSSWGRWRLRPGRLALEGSSEPGRWRLRGGPEPGRWALEGSSEPGRWALKGCSESRLGGGELSIAAGYGQQLILSLRYQRIFTGCGVIKWHIFVISFSLNGH
jgi:hypothetical protein